MADAPTTVNGPATTVNKIIHFALFDVALKAAEAAIIVQAPVLGWPVVNSIFNWCMEYAGGFVYQYFAHVMTFQIIDMQVGHEKDNYTKAEAALRAAHLSGDPNALAKALADFKAAAVPLIRYDGSAAA